MSAIRSRDTKPELKLRRALFALGLRYRLCSHQLPGKPDLVFAGRKAVIFVNGCFWHAHQGCSRCFKPKTHQDYWLPKIERNVSRDKENHLALLQMGWRVLVVWECALSRKGFTEKTAALADAWLRGQGKSAEISGISGEPLLHEL